MGFIDRRRYRRAYEQIVAANNKGGSNSSGSVLILVAPDVDALAACRILARLLVHDHVPHNIVPVSGWAELARINREMVEGNGSLRSVILLNLGSLVDLADFFNLSSNAEYTLHVIDSHRPCNLDNLFSNQPEASNILVWDDGDVQDDMQEERTAYEALEYEPDSDSEEEDIDSEEEDARWRDRQRRLLQDSDSEGGDGDSDGGSSSSSSSRGKRRRINNGNGQDTIMQQPKRLSKAKKALYQNRIQKYYNAGTWYGQSVAGQIYILANEINREDNDTLWLAILGLTYQFTANLIDRERYETYSSILTNEVLRLNIDPPSSSSSSTLNNANNPDDKSIRVSDEFRFMLFRHWNLYDSMYHSGYVAGKMKLYRERGRKNLQGLLAKMGFSLEQCRQTYAHMDMDLKRSLPSKMQDIAPEYGLFDLIYPSFCRVYGFQSILSCGDVVECVSALLEVANGVRLDFGGDQFSAGSQQSGGGGMSMNAAASSTLWNASHWNSSLGKGEVDGEDDDGYGTGGASSDRENPTGNNAGDNAANALARSQEAAAIAAAKAKKREEAWWVRNFWMAYDSLGNDTALLRSSLPLSMALHRSIIRQGISILDKQSIKTLREFRFCVLKEGPDLPVFCHPSTISRLATWLVDGIRDILDGSNALHGSDEGATTKKNKKPRKALPFILAVLDEKRDVFLVVGLTGSLEFGDVSKNKFGLAFQNAARSSKTRTRHDKFDASIVEVRKDDLVSFLQRVNIKL